MLRVASLVLERCFQIWAQIRGLIWPSFPSSKASVSLLPLLPWKHVADCDSMFIDHDYRLGAMSVQLSQLSNLRLCSRSDSLVSN